MVKNHSTGDARAVKIPAERRLTVGTLHYDLPRRKDDPQGLLRRPVRVPWLQLKGFWLRAAGFESQTAVKVQVSPGCLVITLAE